MDPKLIAEVVRQQDEMGWPEMVPAWAELPTKLFKCHRDLNVGDCEQIVEWRTRRAHKWLRRFMATQDPMAMKNAARNILLARLYRCQYFTLIGKTHPTEADMPFSI